MDTAKEDSRTNKASTRALRKVGYGILVVLTGLSYWSARDFVIAQEPASEPIIVSNLTLNYVIFALLLGACSPYVARRLFPRRSKWIAVPVALIMGAILLLAIKAVGMEVRF